MPLRLEVFPPDRILVGVATGAITLEEFRKFLVEVVQRGLLHYRKIIDASLATSTVIGKDELFALEEMLSKAMQGRPRGPLAVVYDPARGQLAHMFKEAASTDRPVEIFRSLPEARRWLMTLPIAEP